MKAWVPLLALLAIPIPAYGAPGDLCWEDINNMCGLLSDNPVDIFSAVKEPIESQIGGFFLVILWGGILGIIWFKTENIMLLGIVGLMVSATITGLDEDARGIGMLLLGISMGILLFQLVRQRVSIFS